MSEGRWEKERQREEGQKETSCVKGHITKYSRILQSALGWAAFRQLMRDSMVSVVF